MTQYIYNNNLLLSLPLRPIRVGLDVLQINIPDSSNNDSTTLLLYLLYQTLLSEFIQNIYKNNEMQTTKLILDDEANGIVRRRSSIIPRKNLKFKKNYGFCLLRRSRVDSVR